MGSDPHDAAVLAALSAALLVVRAIAAAFEASIVATGLPRAQALAASSGTGRARALAQLFDRIEATAFTGRALATFSTVLAGAAAGAAGAILVPASPWLAGAGAAVAAALVSLPLAAAARGLGATHGETVALALAPPFRAMRVVLRPVAWLVSLLTGRRARFSLPRPPLDEMERALAEYARSQPGGGSEATSELIHRVFEFREKVARDVMVPRTDVVAVEVETPVPEIIRILAEEGHSRMPVYRENLDQIEGVLHARDLVPLLAHPEVIVLRDLLRPAHFVPWSKPVDQLLRELQRRHLHMACVVDEHGGIMGLCTIEDVLEEIVGEIRDEYDEEGKAVEAHADGTYTVQGQAPVADFNRTATADVPEDQGFETMAGFLNSIAGAIPAKGDRFFWRGWVFTVADADPRKVTKVRAARVKRP